MVFSEIPQDSLLIKIKNDLKVIPSTSPQHFQTETAEESKQRSSESYLFTDSFCKSFISRTSGERVLEKGSFGGVVLGKGSFGRVVLGNIDKSKVAVKICSRSWCECIGERNGLMLKHPNVARIYRILDIDLDTDLINYISSAGLPLDVFNRFGAQIVVMEFCGRQTLQQLLDDWQQEISVERRNHIMNQIGHGMRYCHSMKVVHLDIKPANVMVMRGDICKLVDFGSSKLIDVSQEAPEEGSGRCSDTSHRHSDTSNTCSATSYKRPDTPNTRSATSHKRPDTSNTCSATSHRCSSKVVIEKGRPLGTVIYCAPEIFSDKLVTPKADIYSFGITMWQMITRVTPFSHFDAHSIIYRVVTGKLRPSLHTIKANDSNLDYIDLMVNCWNHDHNKRPTSSELCHKLSLLMANSSSKPG